MTRTQDAAFNRTRLELKLNAPQAALETLFHF